MQTTVRYDATSAIIPVWLLSAVILISGVHLNVAQAQDSPKKHRVAVAIACGKELTDQCNGVPVHANNMLECLQKDQTKLSKRCAVLANHVVHTCERDAMQRCQQVVAGGGNILGCLTTARGSVSSRCNAALDAVFQR
jgi:hypothetical protein